MGCAVFRTGSQGHLPLRRRDCDSIKKKSRLHFNSWRVVIASWSRWWEKRHYELKGQLVGDCKVIFFFIKSQSRRLSGRPALDSSSYSLVNIDSGSAAEVWTFIVSNEMCVMIGLLNGKLGFGRSWFTSGFFPHIRVESLWKTALQDSQ
jgi:hypothetical protein